MAGRSLGARFGLAINVLLVTGLSLGLDKPERRLPGVRELRGPGVTKEGVPTELYCPRGDPQCLAKLERRQDMENVLYCPDHGPIGDDEALISLPEKP